MNLKNKNIVGIPARMGSTRFPGKPLCKLMGKSMIYHCYKRSELSKLADEVFVATCDKEIFQEVKSFGGNVIMTKKNIKRPGLRVAEAASKLSLKKNDIVVVVQGDEPLVRPEMIDIGIKTLLKNKDIYVVNLCSKIKGKDFLQPGEIKVVCDNKMNAMYMSRSPIPSNVHEESKTDYKSDMVTPIVMEAMNNESELNERYNKVKDDPDINKLQKIFGANINKESIKKIIE